MAADVIISASSEDLLSAASSLRADAGSPILVRSEGRPAEFAIDPPFRPIFKDSELKTDDLAEEEAIDCI